MNTTQESTNVKNSSALSHFMTEMRISSTEFQIVADNPRSNSLWPHRKKSLHTAYADKESLRWLAVSTGNNSPTHVRASSLDEFFPLTPTKLSKPPLSRSSSDLANSPPCRPRRRESYDADENIEVSPVPNKLMRVTTMPLPTTDEDIKSADQTTKENKKPIQARAA